MATNYNGYLMKTARGIVPSSYFTAYDSTPNQETDLNSYQDGNGLTHRNVLPHTKSGISFVTVPLTLEQKIDFMQHFPSRKLVKINYWNDEVNNYLDGEFYIPPIKFTVRDTDNKTIYYSAISIEFIEY
jgi:hypothetical protein